MIQWEYRVETIGITKGFFKGGHLDGQVISNLLNSFGREGWELVGSPTSVYEGKTISCTLMFKRPVAR